MKHLAVFLEEPSARELLKHLFAKLIPDHVSIRYVIFQGKQDLEKHLAGKLRGWLLPDTFFLVLRDQDSADCIQVKEKLVQLCREAGKPETLVRIACRELESWYFGDLEAVEKGLGLNHLLRNKNKRKYRIPDEIVNPAKELMALTQNRYQKIAGSRRIGTHLSLTENSSHRFRVFISGVKELVENIDREL